MPEKQHLSENKVTHDFAKIRPEPVLDKKPAQSPPAWSMMFTGIFVGIALGVFGSVLFYLSGRVPPLTTSASAPPATTTTANNAGEQESNASDNGDSSGLEYEFYHELPGYEVTVDATPVAINNDPSAPLAVHYRLQSGAFHQQALAMREVARQQGLGLEVAVRSETLNGRTLYLVQSGPYTTRGELDNAERILRRNNIGFLRINPQ